MNDHTTNDIPYGYCQCGCGLPAPIAKRTNARLGHRKGEPVRFIVGHHNKVRPIHSLEERFWAKVDRRGPDDCWEWQAFRDKHGYGQINIGKNGKHERSHRVAYQLCEGPIPQGMNVLHRCDNPPCCNPAHLFLGTQIDNAHDMWQKGRGVNPPQNDVKGEHNGRATFTDQEVIDLRLEFENLREKQRVSIAAFAEWHNTPYHTMWQILRRKAYTHI